MNCKRTFLIVAWGVLLSGLPAARGAADKLYLVQTRKVMPLTAAVPSKLSPALRAVQDSTGELRGTDDVGRLVIAVPAESVPQLNSSDAVQSAVAQPPATWNQVKRLKVSYGGSKPSQEELAALGVRLVEDYTKGSFMIVEPLNNLINAFLANKLALSVNVQYATPSYPLKAIPPTNPTGGQSATKISQGEPNDPRLNECWGLRSISAETAWKKGHASDVIVAVIDTGIDYNHDDLRENMWADANGKHGYNFVGNDDDPIDLNGHGTHCAGIIGAVGNNGIGVCGVNWKVKLMAVRWLDRSGSGELIDAIKAIDFAVDHGAKVLSNSWYWQEADPDLEAAVKRAANGGVLFVAAAANFAQRPSNNGGNNDYTSTMGRYPSALGIDNVIAVAAIDEAEQKADFSNFGKKTVHLGAPGVLIMSTVLNNGYDGTYSGTSMAAPFVAGAAALTMTVTGQTDPVAVKKLLMDHVRKIQGLKDRCVTGGTLDLSFLNTAATVAP